jgi:hypothetical protein
MSFCYKMAHRAAYQVLLVRDLTRLLYLNLSVTENSYAAS